MLYMRSPSKKRAEVRGLRPVHTAPLLRVSLNKRYEPSSSVMFTDRIRKAIKKLVLAKSMQESSNKLPNLQIYIYIYVLALSDHQEIHGINYIKRCNNAV